jgi:hypothetical protein
MDCPFPHCCSRECDHELNSSRFHKTHGGGTGGIHSVGAQNIRAMAMVQLLLGNIGVAGGGMNALRGHWNIQ